MAGPSRWSVRFGNAFAQQSALLAPPPSLSHKQMLQFRYLWGRKVSISIFQAVLGDRKRLANLAWKGKKFQHRQTRIPRKMVDYVFDFCTFTVRCMKSHIDYSTRE